MKAVRPQLRPGAVDDLEQLRLVLDCVRLHAICSRSEIASSTGISRAMVGQRVQQLVEAGILAEVGTADSTGGRPARTMVIPPDAGHVLCVDLGATSVDTAVATVGGRILVHRQAAANVGAGPEATLGQVEQLLRDLLAEIGTGAGPLRGIGMGVPGPVQFSTGRPVSPPIMPGWHDYPIRDRLEASFGVPAWVDNDVNIMAIGEAHAGAARGHRDVVWVKVGSGIGAGLISGGVLHRGAQGSAGDLGHVQVVDEGVICRCGNVGCLEALAGGAAIGRDAETAARSGRSAFLAGYLDEHGHIDAAVVSIGADHGDSFCVELLQRSGRLVGHMLATVVNLFNPSLVVIGGGVAQSGSLYLATVRENIYRRSLPLATAELRVVPTSLGEMAGVIGAGTMAADELFSRSCIESTLARPGGRRPPG